MARMLTQREVTIYCRRNARVSRLKKWLEKMKNEIRDQMVGGTKCPVKGPWLIELIPKESKETVEPVDWEKQFDKLAKRVWEDDWKKKKRRIVAGQPIIPVRDLTPSLNVKVNDNYKN